MRVIISIVFCLIFFSGFAQVSKTEITIDFQDITMQEAIKEIEKKSDFKFYYAEEWFDTKTINKTYNDVTISDLLEDLLKETALNFFISTDGRVILTMHSIIYEDIHVSFKQDSISENTSIDSEEEFNMAPILLKKQSDEFNQDVETIRVGKKNNSKKRSYKLSGHIVNFGNGYPIVDGVLSEKKNGDSVVTDEEGYYEIELSVGENMIEISFIGFDTLIKKVIVYSEGSIDFSLIESIELLNEVILEADLNKNINDTTTGKEKLSSEDTKKIPLFLGERNILKVATTLPGISSTGEGTGGFNVRGGKTDQNLILLDDAVIYKPTHFFGLFQALNPLAIQDVNIYKGNIPAEFGGRLSSVFDVSTKKPNNKDITGEFAIGPVTANAVIELPIIKGKAGLMIGGRAAYSDWILKTLDDSNLENSTASFYDFMLKYNHEINKNNELNVSGYYSNDKFSISSDSIYGYSNRVMSLNWNHQYKEELSGDLILANSQYNFNIDYDGSVNNNFSLGYQINESELKYLFNHELNDNHKLKYGISGKYYTVMPGQVKPKSSGDIITPLTIPEEQGVESAIFLSDNIKVNEELQLDFGLRYSFYTALGPAVQNIYQEGIPKSENTVTGTVTYDKNEAIKSYNGPELRLSIRYLLADDFSIKAGYNKTYQYIHTLSNSTSVSPIDIWKLSDAYIKPQAANQISLGFFKNINVNDYEFSIEGFYKLQDNLLDYKTGAKLLLNENIETEVIQGEGKAYGVEFLLRKNIGRLNGWLGYTYSRSLIKLESEFDQETINDGEYFPSNYDKPHDFSLILDFKFSERISLSSNFIYQTGRPVTIPVGNYTFNNNNYVLYSDRNKYRIPDYYRLDLGLYIDGNHKVNKKFHSFWSISVYNVLGRNNPYSVFFVTDDGEIKALQSSIFTIPVPSITYNIKF